MLTTVASAEAQPGDDWFREFARDGYAVCRDFLDPGFRERLLRDIRHSLAPPLAPVEFEADTGYPGAPGSRRDSGGNTPRRLLFACTRYPELRALVTGPRVGAIVRRLVDSEAILMSQNHHNCVMTKYPGFSSLTNWHQDIRYWRFDRPQRLACPGSRSRGKRCAVGDSR